MAVGDGVVLAECGVRPHGPAADDESPLTSDDLEGYQRQTGAEAEVDTGGREHHAGYGRGFPLWEVALQEGFSFGFFFPCLVSDSSDGSSMGPWERYLRLVC